MVADGTDALLYDDALDVRQAAVPRRVVVVDVVADSPGAADDQGTVTGQFPRHIDTTIALAIDVVLEMHRGTRRNAHVQLLPVRAIPAIVDIRQAAAAAERILSNVGHAARDRHRCQCGTTTECIAADAGHTIRNCHGRQAAAVPERKVADAGHALLHDDALDVRPAAVPR